MEASVVNLRPASQRRAARCTSSRAASSSVAMSASMNRIAWKSAIGWPKALRSRARSEEHTSELQSRENLVCRLLLEKKKRWTPKNFRYKRDDCHIDNVC